MPWFLAGDAPFRPWWQEMLSFLFPLAVGLVFVWMVWHYERKRQEKAKRKREEWLEELERRDREA
jgi:preprotein translocase subunit YajC